MKLLAIDTTSRAGSLAVLDDELLWGLVGMASPQDHAEKLIPMVDAFLGSLGLALDALDGLAVAAGPGSFTGLRIGIATAEGLAFAAAKPIAAVSSLDATAHRYRHREGCIGAFLDAQRSEVFFALYRSDGRELSALGDPVCASPETVLRSLPDEPVLLGGSGTMTYRPLIESMVGKNVQIADPSFFLAESVARIGRQLLLAGRAAPLGGIDAIYLRRPDAEKTGGRPGVNGGAYHPLGTVASGGGGEKDL